MRPGALIAALALAVSAAGAEAAAKTVTKPGSVSPLVRMAVDRGPAPPGERHRVVVGLSLRNREDLEAFLADVQDPASPRYRRFLTPAEFEALYAPASADEAAMVAHLAGSGLAVTDRFPNRLMIGAEGSVAALERAFGVAIHHLEYGGRLHYAALADPSLPAAIADAVVGVVGLDDFAERRPHLASVVPAAALGTRCCALAPADLAAFYDGTASYDGSGETIVVAGAYAWRDTDNAAFAAQWALPPLPPGSGQVCSGSAQAAGCRFSSQNSIEIALDVEYAHGTAPGARILNYMAASTATADFTTMYNRIVTDNPGHIVTTSWGTCEVGIPTTTQQIDDAIFANGNALGQSWFAASGDMGSLDCSNMLSVDNPANSPHVIGVGGTTPTCSSGLTSPSPACGGYGSETGWNGSGGGVSQLFARPAFQVGCGVPAGTMRLVPDVALEADPSPGEYVVKGGSWFILGGTSGAAPQWAGYLAALNQKAGGSGFGNPGGLLYGLCGRAAYHDVLTGSNGTYAAGPGYDLVTGLGTIDGSQFLALAAPTATTTTSTSSTTSSTTTTKAPTTTTSTTATTTTHATTTTTSTSSTTTTQGPTTTTATTATTTTHPTTTSTTTFSTTTTYATTTSTSLTMTSSTAGRPSTTSTTLSGCPTRPIAQLVCELRPALSRPECAGQELPHAFVRQFGRAMRLLDRADAAASSRRVRRLLTRAVGTLSRTMQIVAHTGRLSPACRVALAAVLADSRARAAALAASL